MVNAVSVSHYQPELIPEFQNVSCFQSKLVEKLHDSPYLLIPPSLPVNLASFGICSKLWWQTYDEICPFSSVSTEKSSWNGHFLKVLNVKVVFCFVLCMSPCSF